MRTYQLDPAGDVRGDVQHEEGREGEGERRVSRPGHGERGLKGEGAIAWSDGKGVALFLTHTDMGN